MKKIHIKSMLCGLVFLITLSNASAQMATNLVYQVLDEVNIQTKTVIVDGKPYQYKLDAKNSSYRFADDAKNALKLNQLVAGEKYYFELMAKGNDIKNQNYRHVIFISNSKPSE